MNRLAGHQIVSTRSEAASTRRRPRGRAAPQGTRSQLTSRTPLPHRPAPGPPPPRSVKGLPFPRRRTWKPNGACSGQFCVNDEAFYRVKHLPDAITSTNDSTTTSPDLREMIRLAKQQPVTIKAFLPERGKTYITVANYLARLAIEATDHHQRRRIYSRSIFDLATRPHLMKLRRDIVNIAYDAPVDIVAEVQIKDAERRLFELTNWSIRRRTTADSAARIGSPSIWRCRFSGTVNLSGISTDCVLDRAGRVAEVEPRHPRRTYRASTRRRSRPTSPSIRGGLQPNTGQSVHQKPADGCVVSFFSLEMTAEH